jgi:SAM-dependent methyltransferase
MADPDPSMAERSVTRPVIGAAGQRVWDMAHGLLRTEEPGRLLEVAAGCGDLAAQLVGRGFRVIGTDLVDQWRHPEVPFVRADLDMPLPFADGAFDATVLVEGIGYAESPSRVLREFRRVVRPGGAVVITMPNVLSLQSRVRFLLNGTYRWFPHPVCGSAPKAELADVHRDPLRATTLVFLLERAGLTVERIEFGGGTAGVALLPLCWVLRALVVLHNRLRTAQHKRTPAFVSSAPALLHTHVGMLARRSA